MTAEFIAAGGNRYPYAADWDDQLVYGADNNIAIWNGKVEALLSGHTDTVTCVKIAGRRIISASSDRTIRIWEDRRLKQTIQAHDGSINVLAVHQDLIISGSADGTVKIWQTANASSISNKDTAGSDSTFKDPESDLYKLKQTIKVKFIPLALAITILDEPVLAIAGTSTIINIYSNLLEQPRHVASLTGHEGWIRSLDFNEASDSSEDRTLASASQDKLIRLWRFNRSATVKSDLTNKRYQIDAWTAQYDALLIGHEDWIYTVKWKGQRLLSASADNSLAIWKYSDVWVCDRLGEISSQKGSTTATGSTGGFWIGLWCGDSVMSLGRTGSWRRWTNGVQEVGITGHVRAVQSLAWAVDGSYLLTTSLDQTTRLWAERDGWHEMARPQIHGYDLNCIATLPDRFVSGAEEKLLRVFDKPKSGVEVPMLGLSNKATATSEDQPRPEDETKEVDEDKEPTFKEEKIPDEDGLARRTLWPEYEKLYGHGYEISAVAANRGSLIATSCKASTLDHAVIRLYETKTWRETARLSAHTLTVTALAFSLDDRYLLSVGRDRQWAIWEGSNLVASNPAGHSRMILDCAWGDGVFATAGRDKVVKLWRMSELITTFSSTAAVTAVAFSGLRLAFGNEVGEITIVNSTDDHWNDCTVVKLDIEVCPSKSVTSLAWRPDRSGMLAVASEDTSVRLIVV